MKRLNPDKLKITFGQGVTTKEPIIGRKYTLTHSDLTANLFLTIARNFDYSKINPIRDEVLAEWAFDGNGYMMYVYCYVGGEQGIESATLRYGIFRKELPLALEAIRYGDRKFFEQYQYLDTVPIYVYFQSMFPQYNKVEYWGNPNDYK